MYRHKYEKYKAKYLELKRAIIQPYVATGGGKKFSTIAMDAETVITVEADNLDNLKEKLKSALGAVGGHKITNYPPQYLKPAFLYSHQFVLMFQE